ncbi:kinase-like domain-containing protein [Scleroderma yunnanense]
MGMYKANVLVADNNRAWLTNFSCSVMRSVNMTLIPCNVGDFRWRAPEHVKAGVGISAAGDVWAFGMTILELFSANPPFQGEPSEPSLCDRIQQGLLPQRPTRMTDKWWKLCTSCWKLDATSRPSMSTLVGKTKEVSRPITAYNAWVEKNHRSLRKLRGPNVVTFHESEILRVS